MGRMMSGEDGRLPMHVPVVITDGGPWAEHDMACAVCQRRKAIVDVGTSVYQPCSSCQQAGYRLVWKRRWLRPLWKMMPPYRSDVFGSSRSA